MNKNTYNSFKELIKEATKEAWNKYYDLASEGKIGQATAYARLYERLYLLEIPLKDLIEDKKEAR